MDEWRDLFQITPAALEGGEVKAVRKRRFSDEEIDHFLLDAELDRVAKATLATQNTDKTASQFAISQSSLYREYVNVELNREKGQKLSGLAAATTAQEKALSELQRAIVEMHLLVDMTSSIRNDSRYALKTSYGKELDMKQFALPAAQEIEAISQLNNLAHTHIAQRTESFRDVVARRRRFERELAALQRVWSTTSVDKRTRASTLTPSTTYQLDRDLLAIDCFWRPRPVYFRDPSYLVFVGMRAEDGALRLDYQHQPSRSNDSATPGSAPSSVGSTTNIEGQKKKTQKPQQAYFTLQISLETLESSSVVAKYSLWDMIAGHDQSSAHCHLFAESVPTSSDTTAMDVDAPENATTDEMLEIHKHCLRVQHTSLVEELFARLREEVSVETKLFQSSSASGSTHLPTKASHPTSNEGQQLPALFDIASLCRSTQDSLSWQLSENLLLNLTLVPNYPVVPPSSPIIEPSSMHVDDEASNTCDHPRVFRDLLQKSLATVYVTFLQYVKCIKAVDEKKQATQLRMGRQEVFRVHDDNTKKQTQQQSRADILAQSQVLQQLFLVWRTQYQRYQVHVVLEDVMQILLASNITQSPGLVTRTEQAVPSLNTTSISTQVEEPLNISSSPLLTTQIDQLRGFHYQVQLPLAVGTSYTLHLHRGSTTLTNSSVGASPSSGAQNILVQLTSSPSCAGPVVQVTVHDIAFLKRVLLQSALRYSLWWLVTTRWQRALSTHFPATRLRESAVSTQYDLFHIHPTTSTSATPAATKAQEDILYGSVGVCLMEHEEDRCSGTANGNGPPDNVRSRYSCILQLSLLSDLNLAAASASTSNTAPSHVAFDPAKLRKCLQLPTVVSSSTGAPVPSKTTVLAGYSLDNVNHDNSNSNNGSRFNSLKSQQEVDVIPWTTVLSS